MPFRLKSGKNVRDNQDNPYTEGYVHVMRLEFDPINKVARITAGIWRSEDAFNDGFDPIDYRKHTITDPTVFATLWDPIEEPTDDAMLTLEEDVDDGAGNITKRDIWAGDWEKKPRGNGGGNGNNGNGNNGGGNGNNGGGNGNGKGRN